MQQIPFFDAENPKAPLKYHKVEGQYRIAKIGERYHCYLTATGRLLLITRQRNELLRYTVDAIPSDAIVTA